MGRNQATVLLAAFFCASGWVCSVSAIGAENDTETNEAVTVTVEATSDQDSAAAQPSAAAEQPAEASPAEPAAEEAPESAQAAAPAQKSAGADAPAAPSEAAAEPVEAPAAAEAAEPAQEPAASAATSEPAPAEAPAAAEASEPAQESAASAAASEPAPAEAPAAAAASKPAQEPAAAAVMQAADMSEAKAMPVDDVARFDTVSLNVQNLDLGEVLQLLSIQSRRNIVPSTKVSGSVTANLYDVTFNEALDAILAQNGAGYVEKGNFIYVYTLDELKDIQDAQRKMSHRIVRLNYITATDASTFVTPLLSSGGSIAISGLVAAGIVPNESDVGANSFAHEETLIIRDYAENIDEIVKVIHELDTPPLQVMVESTVLQANLNEDLAFGVDLAILADFGLELAELMNPLTAVSGMLNGTIRNHPTGAVNTTVGNVAQGKGGIKVGILTHNVAAFIRALDEVTDTTIIANPKILTLNRQRAEILVGEKVAYLSTTATATATTQTVEFLDTGTKLNVRPFVSTEDSGRYKVRLELKPSISSFELRESGGLTLPDETTQELITNVMVPEGQTVVLGGLFKEETTITRKQVPGLGDVPLLGNAFKGRDDSSRRSEVIFLITPHVIKDKALAKAGASVQDEVAKLQMAAREGLLPWSRSHFTADHVRSALDYYKNNEMDKALWEVDMALSLDPRHVEALRLKEKLTGMRVHMPGKSLLDEAVNLMVEEQTGVRRPTRVPVKPDPKPAELEPLSNHNVDHLEAAAEQPMLESADQGAEPEKDAPQAAAPAMEKPQPAKEAREKASTPNATEEPVAAVEDDVS